MERQRETWDTYFIKLAFMVASRSTCSRRCVGAVLVQDHRVRGTGYNGAPAGAPECLEVGCLMRDGSCVRIIHAEANLILQTDHSEREDATVYCTDRPCLACSNLLANSGIKEIVFCRDYHRDLELVSELLASAGVILRHHTIPDETIEQLLGPEAAAVITVAD